MSVKVSRKGCSLSARCLKVPAVFNALLSALLITT